MINEVVIKTLKNKCANATRHMVLRKLTGIVDLYLLAEFPKSGGTWIGQLISSYLGIPFPRNMMPKLSLSVYHGHYLPSKSFKKIKQIFFLVRDGRDVMVSDYYHSLIWNDKNTLNPKDVLYNRKKLALKDPLDIKQNLAKFMEYKFTHIPSKIILFEYYGNWSSFNKTWLNYSNLPDTTNLIITSYEKFLLDTECELKKLLYKLNVNIDTNKVKQVVDEYSFERQTNRANGVENSKSFLRKGLSGDWKNYFTKESAEIFDHFAGEMLIELGYEVNSDWIKNISV